MSDIKLFCLFIITRDLVTTRYVTLLKLFGNFDHNWTATVILAFMLEWFNPVIIKARVILIIQSFKFQTILKYITYINNKVNEDKLINDLPN